MAESIGRKVFIRKRKRSPRLIELEPLTLCLTLFIDDYFNTSTMKRVHHFWVDADMPKLMRQIKSVRRVRHLQLQGLPKIYGHTDIVLPNELGALDQLRSLTLLNIPYQGFPGWILNLSSLKRLTVRGTEATKILEAIYKLDKLRALRVENCPLDSLPYNLRKLKHLRRLGLADTRIAQIDLNRLPDGLRKLGLGSPYPPYSIYELRRIKRLRPDLKIRTPLDY